MLSLPVTMLPIRSVLCESILYGKNYYIVVAGILGPSTASCRAIHGVKSVGSQDYSQASAILPTVTHPSHANHVLFAYRDFINIEIL